jgi:putative chitinase
MTPELIARCTDARLTRAAMWSRYLNASMAEFQINTPKRQAAYLAQIGHESGGLQFMAEIWGPTDAQKRYEPPSELAERLGNTQPGDGKQFKGRGPIQCTGRFNYRKYGALLGLELERFPQLLDEPANACRVAACFWKANGCNELADAGQFEAITRRINGGLNGQADRLRRWALAKYAVGVLT